MNNQTVAIRAYDPATDLQKVSAIWIGASRIAHAFLGEQRLRAHQVLIEAKYLPMSETWVACAADEPVGFISLLDTYIGGLFVAPDQQGNGIGRRLIAHALHQKGTLSLEVYIRNARALGFYESLGFQEQSRRPHDDEGLPFENAQMLLTRQA